MPTQCGAILASAAILLLACQPDAEPPTAAPAAEPEQPQISEAVRKQLKTHLEHLSTRPMLLAAERLGVTKVRGKAIKPGRRKAGGAARRLGDVPVANNPTADENEPSVAGSPRNKKRLVAGYHFFTSTSGVRCQARHSSDGGKTWSAPVTMPQLTAESQCSDPVLAYSPDGSRVFYAYMNLKFEPTVDFDIIVSYSTDNGASWTGPFIALNGVPDVFLYDKPWITTPDDVSRYVYVTSTRFDASGACSIEFTRSTNGGTAYAAPTTLEAAPPICGEGTSTLVQGSRPAGGKHGNVLVGWYHSGSDGWLTGSFNIRVRHSDDFGATFGPIVTAGNDAAEVPFWLGPFLCYERWWGSMFPDVELDPHGGGHIAYTHDPAPGFSTAEDGDVRYATSARAPYTSWSGPVTVNDDHTVSAQGYVALDVKSEGSGPSGKPHAIWMDHRLPPEGAVASECPFGFDVENIEYDIFYSTLQGKRWSPNVRVTDQSSRTDFIFVGDYIDLTTSNGSLFGIWTDRRDKVSIFDPEDDVWGSRTHRVLVALNP
jgi:hypothetical protein